MIAKIEQATIVVPWSFSSRSAAALNWALDVVEGSSTIRVVHVAAPFAGPDNGVLFEAAEKQKCQDLETRFRSYVSGDERAKNIKFNVIFGNVNQEIVRFSERCQAGLIVMAARKPKGVSKFFFTYLAERVVRTASCSVLVLQGINNTRRPS